MDAGASVRRVAGVRLDSREGDFDGCPRAEAAFRDKVWGIETWPEVITEPHRDSGYVIDFKVG